MVATHPKACVSAPRKTCPHLRWRVPTKWRRLDAAKRGSALSRQEGLSYDRPGLQGVTRLMFTIRAELRQGEPYAGERPDRASGIVASANTWKCWPGCQRSRDCAGRICSGDEATAE